METKHLKDIPLLADMMTAEKISSFTEETYVNITGDKMTGNLGIVNIDGNGGTLSTDISGSIALAGIVGSNNSIAIGYRVRLNEDGSPKKDNKGNPIIDRAYANAYENDTKVGPEGAKTIPEHGGNAYAFGYNAKATNYNACAIGSGTASGGYAFACCGGTASGTQAAAIGASTSSGNSSVALNAKNTASGGYSLAHGGSGDYDNGNIASGQGSHAEGDVTEASGKCSHSEGRSCKSKGYASHAEGYGSIAEGYAAHAEGNTTEAIGDYSHADGFFTKAYGNYSNVSGRHAYSKILNAEGVAADYTFVWNGCTDVDTPYYAQSKGSFCINPNADIKGFYIGKHNFLQCITEAIKQIATDPTAKEALKTELNKILA